MRMLMRRRIAPRPAISSVLRPPPPQAGRVLSEGRAPLNHLRLSVLHGAPHPQSAACSHLPVHASLYHSTPHLHARALMHTIPYHAREGNSAPINLLAHQPYNTISSTRPWFQSPTLQNARPSIHPSIHPSIRPSVRPSVHPFIHTHAHARTCARARAPTHAPIHPPP